MVELPSCLTLQAIFPKRGDNLRGQANQVVRGLLRECQPNPQRGVAMAMLMEIILNR